MDAFDGSGRRWRALWGCFCLALGSWLSPPAATAAERVVVMTSYPQEVFATFEAAFERLNPDLDVEVLWRMPHDALPYLRNEGRGHVDVYWAAAYRNFGLLKRDRLLRPFRPARDEIPGRVGPFRLSDADGFFEAVEMAGFGLISNPGYLTVRGLEVPREWTDLAEERFAGHVILPIPSKVGFAPNLIDTVLQGHGWDAGWRLVSGIAANSVLLGAGSGTIVDEVRSGRRGVGATIDFFANQAIAGGAPLVFRYPSVGGYSFAHVGLLQDASNPSGGERFARFLVSADGQALLASPEIRKLAIRPDAYLTGRFGNNPFADPAAPALRYDPDLGVRRAALVSALFDQFVTRRHAALVTAWETVRAARRSAGADTIALDAVDAAESLLTALPVTPLQAMDPAFAAIFDRRRTDATADAEARALEEAWGMFFERNLAAATRIATDLGPRLAGK